MRTEFVKLLKFLRKTHPDSDLEIVRSAYRVANEAHKWQKRMSGEPYVSHCIAVAKVLAQLELDVTTIAAALLHDTLEDTPISRGELVHTFGEEITALVDGVTKIGALSFSSKQTTDVEKQAVNLRKMLVATAKDVRVILIKLADRLHNIRTIEFMPPEKRVPIARETLDLYAPLAHRLGIARWKWELEDHAFHVLNPVEYKKVAASVAMKRREREAWLEETIAFLERRLEEAEVSATVIGRPKHLYSIYQKMVRQGKDYNQILDSLAVRIIAQTVSGCYNALGVVHHLWPPAPGRFKDYIAIPKANGYQSIHTTVIRENGLPFEIQIRTEEMDRTAREGIAAHWKYKEGERRDDRRFDEHLSWLRQMYEWLQDVESADELIDNVRRDVGTMDVYVFTPKGEVKELPTGSTPLDFAYNVHSEVGHHCIGARVNGRMVPLRYNLQMGDVVEILTSKSQTPHLDWLDLVVTGKARSRIRQRLRELGQLEPLESQLRKDVVVALPMLPVAPPPKIRAVDDATRQKLIRVQGSRNIVVQFAKCCNPMPGQPVIGYSTKTPGITIHRADCKNFSSTERDPSRIIETSWEGDTHVICGLRVLTGQRPNMLADVTNAIRPMNISITRADYRPDANGKSCFEFIFEAPDQESADRVAATVKTVVGVVAVDHMNMRELRELKKSS